jgi:hypothetical protein
MRKIFLSSTARDLGEHCADLARALNALRDYHCVWMKDFYASNATSVESVQKRVQECDVYIGVVGMLYGSCPTGSKISFTQHEYEAAITKHLPRLIFMTTEDFLMSANLMESEASRASQERFRNRLRQERMLNSFYDPKDLKALVIASLRDWELENVEEVSKESSPSTSEPNLGSNVHKLCDRGPQEDAFKKFFRGKIKELPGVPQIYVLQGEERESHHSLIDRLCTVTIEKQLIPQLSLPKEAVTSRLIEWPDPDSPSPREALLDHLFVKIAENEAYPEPNPATFAELRLVTLRGMLALKHEIRVTRWTHRLYLLLDWYCGFWDEVATFQPTRQLFIFLSILYPDGIKEDGWKSWLPFVLSFGACEQDLIDLLNRRQRETERNSGMCPILRLPELRCVANRHVMQWFNANAIRKPIDWERQRQRLFPKRDCVHMASLEPELEQIVARNRNQRQ